MKDRRYLVLLLSVAVGSAFCMQTVSVLACPLQSVVPDPHEQTLQAQSNESHDGSQSEPEDKPISKGESGVRVGKSNDRLFWTLPNFLTVENAADVPPLAPGAKFKLVLRTSFDPVQAVYIGFLAGLGQAENSEAGFGQGAAGYMKRFAASFTDNVDENLWTAAILPSVFHQDPRYYQLGKGGFFHRIGYSISRQIVTRGDSGKSEFNLSEVLGSATAAGISNLYHPASDRTFANTMSVWLTQLAWDTVSSAVKEFWPDIHRAFSKH